MRYAAQMASFPFSKALNVYQVWSAPQVKSPESSGTTDRISKLSESDNPQNLQSKLQSQVLDIHRCKRSRVGSLFEYRGKRDKISRIDVDSQAETSAQHPQRALATSLAIMFIIPYLPEGCILEIHTDSLSKMWLWNKV